MTNATIIAHCNGEMFYVNEGNNQWYQFKNYDLLIVQRAYQRYNEEKTANLILS